MRTTNSLLTSVGCHPLGVAQTRLDDADSCSISLIEPVELLRAARATLRLYQQLATPLAQAHGISYPAALAHQIQERLERLDTR